MLALGALAALALAAASAWLMVRALRTEDEQERGGRIMIASLPLIALFFLLKVAFDVAHPPGVPL